MIKLLRSLFTPKEIVIPYIPKEIKPPEPELGSYRIVETIWGSGIKQYSLQVYCWRGIHRAIEYNPYKYPCPYSIENNWSEINTYSSRLEAISDMEKNKQLDYESKIISQKVVA